MRIVVLGAPGSGKGTQCAILKQIFGIVHISTGELLRFEVSSGTELGRKANDYMESGALVPDDLILGMVEARLRKPDTMAGWLMDGFPRTCEQAEGLREITERLDQRVTAAVILEVKPDVVVARLKGRDRDDDSPEVVRERIRVFEEETRPVFDFFRENYLVHEIDASGSISQVTEALQNALERYSHS